MQLSFVFSFSLLLFCICLISNIDKVVGCPAGHGEGEYQDGEKGVDVPDIKLKNNGKSPSIHKEIIKKGKKFK